MTSGRQARAGSVICDTVAASRKAVIEHLDYVETALTNFKKSTQNEAIAKQRYEHELSR